MKSVFSAFAICLAFSLLNTSSGSPALFKRMPLELEAQQSPNVTDGGVGGGPTINGYSPTDYSPLSKRNNKRSHPVVVARSLIGGHDTTSNQLPPNYKDKAQEYIMPHHPNLDKSDVKVYSDAKNVAFSIPRQTKPGHFVIENNQGAEILEVKPDDSFVCGSGYSYMTVDAKATFRRGRNSGPWSVSIDGKSFTLDSPSNLPRQSTYERSLKNSNGVVDTTIATTLSGSEGPLPITFIDTIRRSTSSACPPEYIVALLVVEAQELNNLNRC